MQSIQVIQRENSDEFLNFLADNLSKKYKVVISLRNRFPYVYSENNINFLSENKNKPIVILYFNSTLNNINKNDTTVFLKDFSVNTGISVINKTTSIICSSDDVQLLQPIVAFSPTVYTCGYGDKNHISISSLRDNDASISLIRTITTNKGVFIHPAEYILNNTNTLTSHEILGATLIFLLFEILK